MTARTRFSVVTPTFNRQHLITRSIASSLDFARAAGGTDVIVVDDASQDQTVDRIRHRYADELASGLLRLIVRSGNGGVTAARNDAVRVSRADWLILIDSDDELLITAKSAIPAFASRHAASPILFFRCEDEEGALIGPLAPPGPLDLVTLLTRGTPGECMPVISRMALLEHPFDEDLRGHEELAFLRLVHAFGPAILSDAVVRRYGTSSMDRLSSWSERLRRARGMARGYTLIMKEFGHLLPISRRLAVALRIASYRAAADVGLGQ